jgi:CMP-N-acetylneuraminic acid synthetase
MNSTAHRKSKVIAVIPARGGSKRLLRKNIYPFFSKPLLAWTIDAAKRAKGIDGVFVSTEDEEIADIAREYGSDVINRPLQLAEDNSPKMVVIRHADDWLKRERNINARILVSLQANSPEIAPIDITRGLEMMSKNGLWEVMSVNPDGIQNAAIRLIRTSALYNDFLSAHIGVIQTDYIDVHTIDDINILKDRYGTQDRLEAVRG